MNMKRTVTYEPATPVRFTGVTLNKVDASVELRMYGDGYTFICRMPIKEADKLVDNLANNINELEASNE